MENEIEKATMMPDCMGAPRHTLPKFISENDDVIYELAYKRREISQNLAKLEIAIEADPTAVSESHKELWRKQAEAMRAYKGVLGERIKDLIDNG